MVKMGYRTVHLQHDTPEDHAKVSVHQVSSKKPHVFFFLTQGVTRWDVQKCGGEMGDSTSIDGFLLRAIEKKAESRWSMGTEERDVRHKHRQSHSRCCKPWLRRQGGDAQT